MSSAAHGQVAAVWPPDRQFGNVRPAKLAMWVFLLSDWLTFAGLLLGYGILRAESTVWHQPGEPSLNIPFTAMLTLVLAVSSVTIIRAYDDASAGNRSGTNRWLAITALLGVLFLVGQYAEWIGILHPGLMKEGLVFGQSAYASTFYVITGFHGAHVVAGVVYLLITLYRNSRKAVSGNEVELLGLFWHFVDFVWNIVFVLVYLIP
ncbi:MAG: heme-copper oxidase subunit III [Myxococcaceae bacterium]